MSGAALLAKLGMGESRFNPNAVSSAGAREEFQFIPGTRNEVLRQTGADAYGSIPSKTRAARIYLRRGGLEGYNPGDPSYPDYILGQKVGNVRGPRGRTTLPETRPRSRPGATPTPDSAQGLQGLLGRENGSDGLSAIIGSLQAENPPVQHTAPALAPFDARRYLAMPEGFQPPSAGAPRPKGPTLTDLLSQVGGAQGPDGLPMPEGAPDFYSEPGAPSKPRQPSRPGSKGGSISFAGGADRPGVRTNPAVKKFARRISGIYGEPLTIGTGTRHSQYTVDGNISDHWGGDAVDIPARGRALIRLGQAALIAAGMPAKRARKIRGGLFNLNHNGRRVQVIFNTQEGGDHTDHAHVGYA